MKNSIWISLWLLLLVSCNNEPFTGEETRIVYTVSPWMDDTASMCSFTNLSLLAIDRNNCIALHETIAPADIHENSFLVKLPVGRYRLALVANCPDLITDLHEPLQNLMLPLPRQGETFHAPHDVHTALQSVIISENKTSPVTTRFFRRVSKLRVTINNIPPEIDTLNFQLSSVPSAVNFTGTGTNSFGTITQVMTREGSKAYTELLTYPAHQGEPLLTVTYTEEDKVKHRIIPFNESLDTNRIVHVENDFTLLEEGALQGNGINLLVNGDFETWNNHLMEPDGWKYYRDGRDSCSTPVSGHSALRGQAAFLQGKTYLYQDIAVEAGKRYEIKMHVNAPSPIFPWKYYCYWRKNKSTALPAQHNKPIQAQNYQSQTPDWINVFNNKIFTAPDGAKLLRVEIRTYGKEILPGEGIYIDDFSVELVE